MNLRRIIAALRRQPLLADVTLAVALAALAAITGVALVAPRAQVAPPSTPVIVAWAVALAAPLVLRRRWPLVVLAVTTLHFTRYWAVGQVNEIASWVILGVAVYSAAAYADRRRARWMCGACLLWLIGSGVVLSARAGPIGAVEVAAIAMFDALPFLLAWPLGAMMRRRGSTGWYWRSATASSTRSGRSTPAGRYSRSACASPGSCTTWSPTM